LIKMWQISLPFRMLC